MSETLVNKLELENPSNSGLEDSGNSSGLVSAPRTGGSELPAGARFAGYTVLDCIGEGGMARVYRARHEGLQRDVAIKILTRGVLPDPEAQARFLEEARIAASIKHPNVVNIFDVGVYEDVPYLVMELLIGRDLDHLLRTEGALLESEIVDIALPVVAGLMAVHEADVVHRDLKPGNIFLSRGPHGELVPKLLDFGISKLKGSSRITAGSRGRLIGTPLYMSPEGLLGEEMTALSDQYSLGVILYECATGVNPFAAESLGESMRRISTGSHTRVLDRRVRPSRRMAELIEKAMSLEPAQRFADLRQLGQELLGLAARRTRLTWALTFDPIQRPTASALVKDVQAGLLAGRELLTHRVPTQARRYVSGGLLLTGLLGWVVALAVLVWLAFRPDPATPRMALPVRAAEAPATMRASLLPAPPKALASPAASAVEGLAPAPELSPLGLPLNPAAAVEVPPSAPQSAPAPAAPQRPRAAPAEPFELAPRGAAPASSGRGRSRARLGTNAAPIFD